MATGAPPPNPTELVYVPDSSWTPAFVGFGLAGILVGLFAGWVWIVVGAALMLLSLRRWVSDISSDLGRLPRRQQPTTAPLPATPMRSAARRA